MKVFITGASGQLGHDVCRELERRGIEYLGVTSQDVDIADRKAIKESILRYRPDTIIHCAAYTKVDRAESDAGRCWEVNVAGTRNLAEACRETGAKLLYVSTDYVFSGEEEGAYETEDPVRPCNVYGKTKLAGELAVKCLLERYFIVRTSWVFGSCGNNFIKTMLRLAKERREVSVVCDQIGSPTYTVDLACCICDMIETEKFGTYHVTNEGFCSWAELAEEVFRLIDQDTVVRFIPTQDYPTPAQRPLNSRLSKESLIRMGFSRLPLWKDAVARFLKGIGE